MKKPAPLLRRAALKRSKFGAKRTPVGDRMFDSKGEAGRAMELRIMEKAGLIRALEYQVTFPLEVNGVHITKYRADFCYFDIEAGVDRVEDFKGVVTDLYRIKKRLMKACHGIDVQESRARKR